MIALEDKSKIIPRNTNVIAVFIFNTTLFVGNSFIDLIIKLKQICLLIMR